MLPENVGAKVKGSYKNMSLFPLHELSTVRSYFFYNKPKAVPTQNRK
jgi:hypothetical protein